MVAKAGRTGRPRSVENQVAEYLEANRAQIPELLAVLTRLALAGNLPAIQELLNRHLGKPRQSLDIQFKAPSITGDDLIGIGDAIKASEVALLGECVEVTEGNDE